jgi:hypothetical protein
MSPALISSTAPAASASSATCTWSGFSSGCDIVINFEAHGVHPRDLYAARDSGAVIELSRGLPPAGAIAGHLPRLPRGGGAAVYGQGLAEGGQ